MIIGSLSSKIASKPYGYWAEGIFDMFNPYVILINKGFLALLDV